MKPMLRGATVLGRSSPSFRALSAPPHRWSPHSPIRHRTLRPISYRRIDPRWTGEWSARDIDMLRQKIRYVFVIFNENRSFDHEYGTLPGVNGLYSDGKTPRSARRHAWIHGDLPRYEYRRDRHRPAIPRRAGTELDDQRLDRSFAYRPCRQDRRAERRSENGQVRAVEWCQVRAAPAAPRAKRWASSSRASSWRMSTATPSHSSGATPAASPSSTTFSPPRTRPRRPTQSR